MNKKVVVVYSGGLDSTVLLTKCKREFDEVLALNFSYGSKHNWNERRAARYVAKKLGVSLYEYDIPVNVEERHPDNSLPRAVDFLKSDLLKSGGTIPESIYDKKSMKSTVVPFRNGIMLALAAGFAESRGFTSIAIANHAGDHTIYPDCRPKFIFNCAQSIYEGTDGRVMLYTPFTELTKGKIVALGLTLMAPLEDTWSCYKGETVHCGKCGTCIERIAAFKENGLIDPRAYKIDIDWTGCVEWYPE